MGMIFWANFKLQSAWFLARKSKILMHPTRITSGVHPVWGHPGWRHTSMHFGVAGRMFQLAKLPPCCSNMLEYMMLTTPTGNHTQWTTAECRYTTPNFGCSIYKGQTLLHNTYYVVLDFCFIQHFPGRDKAFCSSLSHHSNIILLQQCFPLYSVSNEMGVIPFAYCLQWHWRQSTQLPDYHLHSHWCWQSRVQDLLDVGHCFEVSKHTQNLTNLQVAWCKQQACWSPE